MAWPTVTNTFAAGTRAIASKVNQNFTDLKNAIGLTYDLASANYTILDTDGYRYILVTTGSSDRTVTLPTVADNEDRVITIVKIDSDAGQVIVDGEGAETIDGEANYTISDQYGSVTVKSNGSAWYKIYGGATGTGGAAGRNYLEDWFDATKNIGTVTNGIGNTLDTSDRTGDKTTWGSSDTSLLTIARSTSSPLRQTYSYLITEAGSSSGAFIESPLFSLDAVDLGKPVTVSFDCADNAVSDDYQVYMCRYDSNDVLKERIPVAGTASATSPYSARIPTGTTKFQGFFIAGSTSADQYALRIVSNSNSAASIKIDSLYVGPEKVVQGAAVTDWVSYTPTSNWVSGATHTGKWRRVGKNMQGRITLTMTGAVTAANLDGITLPSGYTIDTDAMSDSSPTANTYPVGQAFLFDKNTNAQLLAGVYNSSTANTFRVVGYDDGASGITNTNINATTPWTWAVDDEIHLEFEVPIVGWSSNITMADRAVEEQCATSSTWDADDTGLASLVRGYAGGAITGALTASRTKRVRFNTPIQVNDDIQIKFARGSGQVYTLSAQFIDASGNRIVNSESSLQTISTSSGVYWRPVSGSSTDIDVIFARYAALANDDSPAQDWVNGWYWIANKVSGGAAVGYPIGARNIVGDTTGTAVPSGYIGEIKEANGSAVTPTSGQYSDGGNAGVYVTKGTYIFYVRSAVTPGTMSAVTRYLQAVSTSSGNAFADAGELNYRDERPASHTPSGSVVWTFTTAPILVTSDATYYPKVQIVGTIGTGVVANYIRAVRIA